MSPILWVMLAVVVAIVLFRFSMARRSPAQVLEMRNVVESGGVLLDVRTPDEFRVDHLRGALNIPLQSLQQRIGELDDKGRGVVVCCHSGMRSRAAAGILRAAGYERVLDLGPTRNWDR